ncbi:MAG: hypothetical protein IKK29_00060, partial [Christensenellaceae bacterium]|nr:hypothetical protein [Christensenellaceae bacterium]
MKKSFLICLLVLAILLLPVSAFADEVDIFENEFTEWVGEIPYNWDFDSLNGGIERGGGEAEIYTDYGYAFISTIIELEPSSAYRISADVSVFDVPADSIGANINIMDQYAESGYLSGTVAETIELYVETNVDETQFYTLRIGLGNEENYSSGTVNVDSVKITKIDSIPEDENVYTLIGSFSYEDIMEEDTASDDDSAASVASYNTTGTVLVGLLFSLLFYLFFTSRWAKRFSEKTSEFYILTAIFLFSFVLRVFLSSRSEGHITDLNCFKAWAVNLQTYGLSGFYESGIFADYMPGYYYILYIIGYIYNIFGFTYESVAFRILVEFVPILCDLALAFFAYRIIRKSQNKRIASLCAIFLLFIPFSFTDSVIWGQIDSVFTLALLGSLYLLKTDKKVFSCLLWAVSLMIKPQALLVAPVIAIVFLKDLFTRGSFKKTLLDAIISLVVIAASVLLLSLPMKGSQPLLYIVDRMLNTTGQYAYGTVNAFNFFGLLGGNFVVDTTPVLFGLTYRTLGWLLIILSTALTGFLYFRKGTKKDIFLYSGLYLLLIYVFAHNMHERYVYPALVLLAVSAFERDSREIFFPTAVLGGLFFANMFIVLEFRQEFVLTWITSLFSILYVL